METAIRQFRVRNQIPARLIVEAIRRGYPKFDAPMLSRVESGAYGADLKMLCRTQPVQFYQPYLSSSAFQVE